MQTVQDNVILAIICKDDNMYAEKYPNNTIIISLVKMGIVSFNCSVTV